MTDEKIQLEQSNEVTLEIRVKGNASIRLQLDVTVNERESSPERAIEEPGIIGSPQSLGDGPKTAKRITAAKNSDGRLEIFYIGPDDAIYHSWQLKPNGGGLPWTNPSPLIEGRTITAKQIVAARNHDGHYIGRYPHLELFFIGMDNAVYHTWQKPDPGGWTDPKPLIKDRTIEACQLAVGVGYEQTNPTPINFPPYPACLQLLFTDLNNVISLTEQTSPATGPWSSPVTVHATDPPSAKDLTATTLALEKNKNQKLEFFFVDPNAGNQHIWHSYQLKPWENSGGWSGWSAPSVLVECDQPGQQLAAGKNTDGRLELFYLGPDNVICHTYQLAANKGGWEGRNSLIDESLTATKLAIARNADGRLELFYIDTSGAICHTWQKEAGKGPWHAGGGLWG